ncbi:protein CHUP1, chloroplastic isoform X2 [Olea europaea var. sylvestris]|uniref:protein CHUP1, chloroplastic isoform X2 n=1 Tax=Olea europaea var. sylvestris TaxID=158386 RepID=UPI000C1D4A9A|nr:protein CHUP1, chloroplastic isoform X2 [Olea europaea var. sylvestris]
MVKEKRDIRPELLKFGVAFALSLGGILYTLFKNKKIKPDKSQPPQPSQDVGGESRELENDDEFLHKSPNSRNSPEISLGKYVTSGNSTKDLSPNARYIGDRDGYLLPEFVDLVKECDSTVKATGISPRKNMETQALDVESPRGCKYIEHEEPDREIRSLKSKVKMLQERERSLEIQLLEYYGLKEQETAVMELQNRLKLNNMEAKLYNLKIESLQANNRRLEAEVADYAQVVSELEAAKAKIKLLRKKLRSEAEQNREQILTLQERVMKLQDQEMNGVKNDPDMKYKLQKLKELEVEIEDLRESNHGLKQENSELAKKLEYLQMIATSALDNEETQAHKKESHHLRQQNENLTKEIEQLQAERCSDVEELVYLRWINACLRYELRNYQPAPGKTIARDLSKSLSPKSEEKAKQLILEYANKEGSTEKGINIADFDSDRWSSSQGSFLSESGDGDDSSVDTSLANKTSTSSKTKVFSKLMRLLRGKDNLHHSRGSPLDRTTSVEDKVGRCFSDSQGYNPSGPLDIDPGADGHTQRLKNSSERLYRHSLDLQRSYSHDSKTLKGEGSGYSRRNSDDSSLSIYRRIDSIREEVNDSSPASQLDQDAPNVEKTELVKYAKVLKNSRSRSSSRRRSALFSSF